MASFNVSILFETPPTIFIFLNEHDRRRDPLKLTLKNVLLEKRTLEEIDLARRLFEYLRFSMCLL